MPSKKGRVQKQPDSIAAELDQTTTHAGGFYANINRDMSKAMSLLKKGAFREAIHLVGTAASNSAQLHRALLYAEDLMVRMKKREEFKVSQIKLIENPDMAGKAVM